MNQLQAMRVFIRVVSLASFGLAAKQLGMSAAAVTRSISMLEAHLNVRLLNRSARCVTVTDEGHAYLVASKAIIDQLDEMESNLVRSTRELSGTLRLAASTPFAHSGLAQLLATYRGINPGILRMHAGGVATPSDARSIVAAGADGTGSTSGVVLAIDPAHAAQVFIRAVREGANSAPSTEKMKRSTNVN